MKINKIIENSKMFEALRKSKYFKKCNHSQLKSGRFPYLPRFTKLQNYLLESLYTLGDMKKPSAFRIYLYLLRQVTGYNNRIGIEYRPKKFMAHMKMGTCLYGGIKCLENKNMIYFYEKDGVKWIGLNPYPDTWVTDSAERIDEIIQKEINEILENTDDALMSISSSSWSSSSSSSESYPSDGEAFNNQLLEELDNM